MRLRPATMDDAELLFDWRNDSVTRAMFRNSDLVNWDEHVHWLQHRLSREAPHLYVAEVDDVPVAMVRLDDAGLSFAVAPKHRRKGVATSMLKEVYRRFGKQRAEIKSENVASIRAAESAGHEVVLI